MIVIGREVVGKIIKGLWCARAHTHTHTHTHTRTPTVLIFIYIFLAAQMVKNLPGMQETWVGSLGREVPLEKEGATHSSIPV